MTVLPVVCIILGCFYIIVRFPLAVTPKTSAGFLRKIFESNIYTRIFGVSWLVPWCLAVYSSLRIKIELSTLISVWGTLGIIRSLHVVVFPGNYRRLVNSQLDKLASSQSDAFVLRLYCLFTTFLGLFLIYLGVIVF